MKLATIALFTLFAGCVSPARPQPAAPSQPTAAPMRDVSEAVAASEREAEGDSETIAETAIYLVTEYHDFLLAGSGFLAGSLWSRRRRAA